MYLFPHLPSLQVLHVYLEIKSAYCICIEGVVKWPHADRGVDAGERRSVWPCYPLSRQTTRQNGIMGARTSRCHHRSQMFCHRTNPNCTSQDQTDWPETGRSWWENINVCDCKQKTSVLVCDCHHLFVFCSCLLYLSFIFFKIQIDLIMMY